MRRAHPRRLSVIAAVALVTSLALPASAQADTVGWCVGVNDQYLVCIGQ